MSPLSPDAAPNLANPELNNPDDVREFVKESRGKELKKRAESLSDFNKYGGPQKLAKHLADVRRNGFQLKDKNDPDYHNRFLQRIKADLQINQGDKRYRYDDDPAKLVSTLYSLKRLGALDKEFDKVLLEDTRFSLEDGLKNFEYESNEDRLRLLEIHTQAKSVFGDWKVPSDDLKVIRGIDLKSLKDHRQALILARFNYLGVGYRKSDKAHENLVRMTKEKALGVVNTIGTESERYFPRLYNLLTSNYLKNPEIRPQPLKRQQKDAFHYEMKKYPTNKLKGFLTYTGDVRGALRADQLITNGEYTAIDASNADFDAQGSGIEVVAEASDYKGILDPEYGGVQFPAAETPTAPEAFKVDVARSQEYNQKHYIQGSLPDGFIDPGRHAEVKDDGTIQGPKRESLFVDRQKDPKLKKLITEAQEKTEGKSEAEKAFIIAQIVDTHIKAGEYKNNIPGAVEYIGNVEEGGVCRHKSLLFQVLASEAGINSVVMRRGYLNGEDFKGEAHTWNEIEFENKKYIVDLNHFGEKEMRKDFDLMKFEQFQTYGGWLPMEDTSQSSVKYYDIKGNRLYSKKVEAPVAPAVPLPIVQEPVPEPSKPVPPEVKPVRPQPKTPEERQRERFERMREIMGILKKLPTASPEEKEVLKKRKEQLEEENNKIIPESKPVQSRKFEEPTAPEAKKEMDHLTELSNQINQEWARVAANLDYIELEEEISKGIDELENLPREDEQVIQLTEAEQRRLSGASDINEKLNDFFKNRITTTDPTVRQQQTEEYAELIKEAEEKFIQKYEGFENVPAEPIPFPIYKVLLKNRRLLNELLVRERKAKEPKNLKPIRINKIKKGRRNNKKTK